MAGTGAGPGSGSDRPAGSRIGSPAPGQGAANPQGGTVHTKAGFGALRGAQAAPDPRFFAYVWPAIALGGAAGAMLAAALDLPFAATILPTPPDLPRLLSDAAAAMIGDGGATASSAAPDQPQFGIPSPPPYSPDKLPDGGGVSFILLLLLCVAPLTLFAYGIRRELRTSHRWPFT